MRFGGGMTKRLKIMPVLSLGLLVALLTVLPAISLASQPKIGLDLEWRPIEGTDAGSLTDSGAGSGGGAKKTFTINGVSFTMIRVPAGEFMMGSPSSESERDSDETQHRVRITKDYWIGETEVTQGLWKAVMGTNPSSFSSCLVGFFIFLEIVDEFTNVNPGFFVKRYTFRVNSRAGCNASISPYRSIFIAL